MGKVNLEFLQMQRRKITCQKKSGCLNKVSCQYRAGDNQGTEENTGRKALKSNSELKAFFRNSN